MSVLNNEKDNSLKSLKKFIIEWNNKYPIDRWWRLKFNVPFNSKEHRRMTLIDIKIAYEEEKMYQSYFEDQEKFKEDQKCFIETGEWLSKRDLPEDEKSEIYDNLDLDAFNNIVFD